MALLSINFAESKIVNIFFLQLVFLYLHLRIH